MSKWTPAKPTPETVHWRKTIPGGSQLRGWLAGSSACGQGGPTRHKAAPGVGSQSRRFRPPPGARIQRPGRAAAKA